MHSIYKLLPIIGIFIAYVYYHMKIFFHPELNLLIGIMSSRSHFEHRNAIRSTWKSNLPTGVDALFVIGKENCQIPPEDRWGANSCNFWNVQLPKNNETQWICRINFSISKPKPANKGFIIKLRHPIIISKLGVLKNIMTYTDTTRVLLVNSISEDILVKVQFSSSKLGVEVAGYYYQPISPIVLPKDFEATLILENDVPSELLVNQKHSWNTTHGLFSFANIIGNDDHLSKWNSDALSAVSFGFTVYDFMELKNHISGFDERQQLWHDNLQRESLQIENELSKYNDILLVDVVDIYRNLPLKLLKFYKWIAENYIVDFVMKTDDDVFVNAHKIVQEMKALKSNNSTVKKIWWSRFRVNWAVDRFGKWRELDYDSLVYPPFGCGLGYIISDDVLKWLARNSEELHPYQGEDVSLGIWLAAIGPNYINDISWQCESSCTNNSFNIGQLSPLAIQNAGTAMQKCSNMCGCD